MEHNSLPTQNSQQIPPIVWFLGIGLVIALIAIFVFNLAVNTVAYFGLFAFFVGSHFFMHGGHGGHGGHSEHQSGAVSNPADVDKDEHAGHSGGCH